MGVSKNNGKTPKLSILIGSSNINHPFWGTRIFGNIHISFCFISQLPPHISTEAYGKKSSCSSSCPNAKTTPTCGLNVSKSPRGSSFTWIPLGFYSLMAGVISWMAGVTSWMAGVTSWMAGVTSWMAGGAFVWVN